MGSCVKCPCAVNLMWMGTVLFVSPAICNSWIEIAQHGKNGTEPPQGANDDEHTITLINFVIPFPIQRKSYRSTVGPTYQPSTQFRSLVFIICSLILILLQHTHTHFSSFFCTCHCHKLSRASEPNKIIKWKERGREGSRREKKKWNDSFVHSLCWNLSTISPSSIHRIVCILVFQ